MDYSIAIPNTRLFWMGTVTDWLNTNVGKNNHMWDSAAYASVIYFKFEADLLAFRLRWGV